MSKCPFKLMKAPYDGGSECDPECAWLVEVHECSAKPITVCAMVLAGNPADIPIKPLNPFEGDGHAR